MNEIIAKGPRLRIRRFLPKDAPAIFAFSQEECTRRELPDEVFDSLEQLRDALRQFNQNAETGAYPLVFCIALSENDAAIGHVSLSPISNGRVEIGYAIAEAYQGKGYATQAAILFSDWALSKGGLKRLYGIVKEKNPASIRCLEKAGYTLIFQGEKASFGGIHTIREYIREA